jgi:hypothetical protein
MGRQLEEQPIAPVDFAEAKRLADAAAVYQDLGFAIDALNRREQLLANGEPDPIGQQVYWTSALISYARCFATGKRLGLSESIFDGIQGKDAPAISVHRLYIDLRNKHIAHSVNAFEQALVGLVLASPARQHRTVEGVATLGMKLITLNRDGVISLRECARIARSAVAKLATQLEADVLAKGRQLRVDELYDSASAMGLKAYAPGHEEASAPRRR